MNKRIKSILRCYAAGMGIKETASTFHTSRNKVRKYFRLFQAEKVLSSFFPSPMSSCMKCSAVRNPGIGTPLPDRLN